LCKVADRHTNNDENISFLAELTTMDQKHLPIEKRAKLISQ